jgi:hypothetical protein
MMFRTAFTSALTYVLVAAPALAHHRPGHSGGPPSTRPAQVPEIDASAGFLTMAAMATVLLFVWERQRRQAK